MAGPASTRGFTVFELMIFVVVLAIFASMCGVLATQARREHRAMTGYQTDVLECRAAMRALESDLRATGRLEHTPTGVTTWVGDDRVDYELRDDGLWRRGPTEHRRLARCIAALTVTRREGLADVVLQVRGRTHRAAELRFSVAARNQEVR